MFFCSILFLRDIFRVSLSRFTRQTNSAKLGRPIRGKKSDNYHQGKSIQFGPIKRHQVFQAKETDTFVRQHQRSSTSTSRTSRAEQQQQQQAQSIMMKINSNHHLSASSVETPNLLRRCTIETKSNRKDRSLRRCKPQITL